MEQMEQMEKPTSDTKTTSDTKSTPDAKMIWGVIIGIVAGIIVGFLIWGGVVASGQNKLPKISNPLIFINCGVTSQTSEGSTYTCDIKPAMDNAYTNVKVSFPEDIIKKLELIGIAELP